MIIQPPTLNAIRVARVCHVHPESHSFDGIFCDTGDYCRNVQVLSPMAGTDFGFSSGIPAPEEEGWDENREINPDRRDLLAVVTTCSAGLLCLGFLYPQVNHLAFTKSGDKNRMIERHTSDWYRTVDDMGNMDIVHPGLALGGVPKIFMRMGVGPLPAILTGRDYDNRFALKRNPLQQAMITLASPFGILLAGGKETVAVGVAASAASSVASGSSAMSGTALMSATMPAVDWIAEAALADADVPCVDENDNGICDDLETIREEYTNTFIMNGGGCSLRSKKGRIDMTVEEDKTSFVFSTEKATFSMYGDKISLYVGDSSGIQIKEDKIVLQVGETKLELTADGITTTGDITHTGDMVTSGVHTDANGTHG